MFVHRIKFRFDVPVYVISLRMPDFGRVFVTILFLVPLRYLATAFNIFAVTGIVKNAFGQSLIISVCFTDLEVCMVLFVDVSDAASIVFVDT